MSDYHNFGKNERSLLIRSLLSFDNFTIRNLFQNGANNMSKMVNIQFVNSKLFVKKQQQRKHGRA